MVWDIFLKIRSWLVYGIVKRFITEIRRSAMFSLPHVDPDPEPSLRIWECLGQKSFKCLGEWHKSEFARKHSRRSSISGKVGGGGGGGGGGGDHKPPVPHSPSFHQRACDYNILFKIGFHAKPGFFFYYLKWWPVLGCLDHRALLDLPRYVPDS